MTELIEQMFHGPAVLRGMEWLDEHHPGWEWDVDLDVFSLSSCTQCVLGQVIGDDYTVALRHEGLTNKEGRELGFSLPDSSRSVTPPTGLFDPLYPWKEATRTWKDAIDRRRLVAGYGNGEVVLSELIEKVPFEEWTVAAAADLIGQIEFRYGGRWWVLSERSGGHTGQWFDLDDNSIEVSIHTGTVEVVRRP